jgi:chemotaxis methyl-accepting protein methylase
LTATLRPRLGHGGPWPAEAHRFVQRRAAEQRVDPSIFLRTIEGRPQDLAGLIAAATVPHTAFHRHPEQIARFRELLPAAAARSSPVRIWSAGCATGEEPWTLAMVAEEAGVPVEIVAMDVSAVALAKATRGHYEPRDTRSLPGFGGKRPFIVSPELRERVRFRLSSILAPMAPEDRAPFDFVFCRNVLIYFDPASIDRAWRLFEERTHSAGHVVVAPVEALLRVPARFQQAGPLGFFERTRPEVRLPRAVAEARPPKAPRVEAVIDPDAAVVAGFEKVGRLLRASDTEAAERLLHALLAQRDDALGWFLLGETCARRGELTQARIAYARAVKATVVPPEVDLETVRGAAGRRARQL